MQGWLYLVVVGVAIWVAVDASRLGAKRGALGGGMLDMGPVGWFFACLLLWIVAFPCYLVTRPKLVRSSQGVGMHPQYAAAAHAGSPSMPSGGYGYTPGLPTVSYPEFSPPAQAGPAAPAPGWYPNPEGQGMRWWNGGNWTSACI